MYNQSRAREKCVLWRGREKCNIKATAHKMRQKIFTCRLVCGEFRQICDKIRACRAIFDSARSQNVLSGLVGQCAVDQDKLSWLACTSTNEELSWESREQAAKIDSAQSLNAVSRDKKSASVRQADVLTNLSWFDPDKKSAALRQKNRLVRGNLNQSQARRQAQEKL